MLSMYRWGTLDFVATPQSRCTKYAHLRVFRTITGIVVWTSAAGRQTLARGSAEFTVICLCVVGGGRVGNLEAGRACFGVGRTGRRTLPVGAMCMTSQRHKGGLQRVLAFGGGVNQGGEVLGVACHAWSLSWLPDRFIGLKCVRFGL